MLNLKRLVLAVGLLAGCGSWMMAQDATGKVIGVVTDATGGVVPGAKVTVTNVATNISHDTTTDQRGSYQVLQLPIGKYRVTTEATGFDKVTIDSQMALEINQSLRVDVKLQVGKTSNVINVESTVASVETENQTLGGTVTGAAIYELPLNGRNTLDLIGTQPGVTPTNPDSGAAGNYSIGGGRTDSVTYLLDGGLNNDLLSNNVVANPNPDAVAEFRVLESNYSAEYGRNAGGIVSIVTKSGSNQFHGTAYDYLRNNFFDAIPFFNNQQGLGVPVLKRNQYGGTIGGPILKNKLFFFFAYEGQKQTSLDTGVGRVTTYTPAEANGDFSASQYASSVAAFLGQNPYYQSNPTLAAQGIIDPTKIDPVAKAYFANGLIPTSASGFLFPQGAAKDNYESYFGKIDYTITDRDVVSASFSNRDEPFFYPFGSSTDFTSVPGFPTTYSNTTNFGSVAYTHTFTPALLNELRVTAQRLNHSQAIPAGKKITASQLGANVPSDDPTGPPVVFLQGSGTTLGYSLQGPTKEIDNTYAFYDNLSWNVGRHSFKGGFYFSPYQNNTVYDFYVNGAYYFYGTSTSGSGVDLADFLLGNPNEFVQFGRAPSNIRSNQYSGFVQDSWKMTKTFTLSLGLRYEYAQPKYDTQGRSFSYLPGLQSTRFTGAPTGLLFPGDAGAPRGSNFADKNDFAPRMGFAWDVFGNAKTSVRGGLGMFYDILKGEDNLQFNGQAPFFGFADVLPTAYTGTGVSGLQDPYASAGAVNPFPSKAPSQNLDFGGAGFLPFGGSGVYFVDPHLRTPYVFQYNLSIQQELPGAMIFELGYLGYSAHKLTGLVDVNPFVLGTDSRINPNFSYLNEFQNIGKAGYNAMEANLRRRFADMHGWGSSFFTLGYTWSHEIDNASGFRQRNSNVPYYNHGGFRASGDSDVRQVLTLSGGWELPFAHLFHGPKLLTSGWTVYPLLTLQSGFPLDVFAGLSTFNSDPGPSGAGDAGSVRADLVGTQVATYNPKSTQGLGGNGGNYYFNPANFDVTRLTALDGSTTAVANPYGYGTLPRNAFRGPGRTNLDISISKHFLFTERNYDLELRGDAFNVANHTEFKNPETNPLSAQFGQVSTTYDARILQVALHFAF